MIANANVVVPAAAGTFVISVECDLRELDHLAESMKAGGAMVCQKSVYPVVAWAINGELEATPVMPYFSDYKVHEKGFLEFHGRSCLGEWTGSGGFAYVVGLQIGATVHFGSLDEGGIDMTPEDFVEYATGEIERHVQELIKEEVR